MEGGIKGELVHFGSPRLGQLFQTTKEMGAYIQMFEKVETIETKSYINSMVMCEL